jgi:hypothetical protein
MGAFTRNVDWPRFSSAIERIRALGYSHPERQVHVACLFARWAHRRHEHEAEARSALDQAEQEALRAGPSDPSYEQMRTALSTTRGEIEGVSPPSS